MVKSKKNDRAREGEKGEVRFGRAYKNAGSTRRRGESGRGSVTATDAPQRKESCRRKEGARHAPKAACAHHCSETRSTQEGGPHGLGAERESTCPEQCAGAMAVRPVGQTSLTRGKEQNDPHGDSARAVAIEKSRDQTKDGSPRERRGEDFGERENFAGGRRKKIPRKKNQCTNQITSTAKT